MALQIKGMAALRERLAAVRPAEVMARALEEQAEKLAESVRQALGEPAGAGEHDTPWLRTGALRDSVGATADGLEAVVGSSDEAAAPQEMGTRTVPPRPFLAPAAMAAAPDIAHAIGEAVRDALKGQSSDR